MALLTLHSTTCDHKDLPDVEWTLNTFDLNKLDTEIIPHLIKKPAYRKRMLGVCQDMFNYGYLNNYHDSS